MVSAGAKVLHVSPDERRDTAQRRHWFRVHLGAACVVLTLAIWLSSGTLTPCASTFFNPIVSSPCGYLYNVDHPLHEATFWMLDGQPSERWRDSPVLRRILFPLVAYPFMKVAGFEVGGFQASLLCQLAGLIALALFLRRQYGEVAGRAGMWLCAAYPGITYWAALPYAYAAIVPASLALFVLLTWLDDCRGWRPLTRISLAMGLLFTAYDLLPFFGVAAVLVLLRRRRFAAVPLVLAGMAAPPALSVVLLKLVFSVPWSNPNTAIYGQIVSAYMHPPALGAWLREVADFPFVLIENFFYSNMIFLPALFLALLVVTPQTLTVPEGALFIAVTLVFLFNNLAPSYPGRWQMRGDFIPRLYQPLGAALLVYCARAFATWRYLPRPKAAIMIAAGVLVLAANLSITFGPIARVPWASTVYGRFYMHSGLGTMDRILALHGRRPLGFCRVTPQP